MGDFIGSLARFEPCYTRFRSRTSGVLESNTFLIFMVIITTYSLVGRGLSVLFLPAGADGVIQALDQIVIAIFILEVVVTAMVRDGYLFESAAAPFACCHALSSSANTRGGLVSLLKVPGSFYFWLDIASVTALLLASISNYSGASVSYLKNNGVSHRFTQVTKVTGQLSKVLRLVRSFSFFRIIKFSQKKESAQEMELDMRVLSSVYSEEWGDEKEGEKEDSSSSSKMKMGSHMSSVLNKRIIIGGVLAIAFIPLFTYSNQIKSWNFSVYVLEAMAASPTLLQNFTSMLAHDNSDLLYVTVQNSTLLSRLPAGLRSGQQMKYMGTTASIIVLTRQEAKREAANSTLLVVLIVILFGTLIYLLNQDLTTMIVKPVSDMIYLIETISLDPLANISSNKISSGRQGLETTLLIQTIGKIASLVKIGFGEAGADIIRRNLYESTNFKLNLFSSGHIVNCVFTFCDIRNFTDTTECLQEEVMVFVNRIACILHSLVVQCGGAANKNVGDAFLLLWKIDDGEGMLDDTHGLLADKALYCILKFTCELIKQHAEVCTFSTAASQRLYQRMPDYRPKVGFGLHKGWAVEGAIGSDQKIDVSYISPDVTYVEFLQDLSKDYGVTVILSASFFRMLSSQAQYQCRQLDCIKRVSEEEEPCDIFTHDCNLEEVIALMSILHEYGSATNTPTVGGAAAAATTSPTTAPNSPTPSSTTREGRKAIVGASQITFAGMPLGGGGGGGGGSKPSSLKHGMPMLSKARTWGTTALSIDTVSPSSPKRASFTSGGSGHQRGATNGGAGGAAADVGSSVLNTVIPPYEIEVWERDLELQALRRGITSTFRTTWNFAMSSYLAGEWSTALNGFQTTLEMSQGTDKASKFLISVIEKEGGSAPAGWAGFRSI